MLNFGWAELEYYLTFLHLFIYFHNKAVRQNKIVIGCLDTS